MCVGVWVCCEAGQNSHRLFPCFAFTYLGRFIVALATGTRRECAIAATVAAVDEQTYRWRTSVPNYSMPDARMPSSAAYLPTDNEIRPDTFDGANFPHKNPEER